MSRIITDVLTLGDIPFSVNLNVSLPSVSRSFAAVNVLPSAPEEFTTKVPVKLVLLISAEDTPVMV